MQYNDLAFRGDPSMQIASHEHTGQWRRRHRVIHGAEGLHYLMDEPFPMLSNPRSGQPVQSPSKRARSHQLDARAREGI
jgi:hypothetical protein